MGSRSGVSTRGYHPAIWGMRESMALREQIKDQAMTHTLTVNRNKKLSRSYWLGRLANAMSALKAVDPEGWQTWFDSSAVPEVATFQAHALLVESRITELMSGRSYCPAIARLYRGTFVWTDTEGAFIFTPDNQLIEFNNAAEARAYVDNLVDHGLSARLPVYAGRSNG